MSDIRPLTGSRRVGAFVTVSLALLMSTIDQTVVATGLHTLQVGLATSISWVGWTITGYSLGQVIALPVAGVLAERHGRRRVFFVSAFVFTGASLCCGLVDSIYLLIIFRIVQAMGGAGFTPSATGIIVTHFGSARDRAVGLFGSIFSIGAAVGPVLGGVVLAHWSWRAIFIVNVPIGLILLVMSIIFIPRDTQVVSTTRTKLDFLGLGELGVALLSAMMALSTIGGLGHSTNPLPWILLGAGSICAASFFIRRMARSVNPLIPIRLISGRDFGIMNVVNILYGGAAAGIGSLVPLFAIQRYHMSVLSSGTLLSARSVAIIIFSGIGVLALRRTGYRGPMMLGFGLTGIGTMLLAIAPMGMTPYVWLAAASAVTGVGLGWSGPATRNASLQLAPDRAATIAALRTLGRQLGSIISVATATAILSRANDPVLTEGRIFAVFGLILLVAIPTVRRVPEHRGSW